MTADTLTRCLPCRGTGRTVLGRCYPCGGTGQVVDTRLIDRTWERVLRRDLAEEVRSWSRDWERA